jgi:aminoglycoside 6'-N-acetyltransferase I
MRDALWPDSLSDHDADTHRYFTEPNPELVTFVADIAGKLVGFLELGHRAYAPGCESTPVPFVEGWYVEPNARGRGVGRALILAAESWARTAGHHELASDAEAENADGVGAHGALGFETVERLVCFRKGL